jgi:peptide/nickel transport system substrate-binding protein
MPKRMMRRRCLLRGLCVALGMPLSHAGADSEPLRVAITALPAQVTNPFRYSGLPAALVTDAIFDGLTAIDRQGAPQPALALRWEQRDTRVWRFYLRPGVQFSNGKPFTSDAVVFAIDYLKSPEASAENLRTELANIVDAAAIDPLTVDLVTAAPDVLLPRLVSMLRIVEPSQWRRLGRVGFAREPVGTGPFRVDRTGPTAIRLSAFADSWRRPRVKRLEFLAVPDSIARVQALQSRRVHIAMMLGPDDLPNLELTGERLLVYPTGGVFGVVFITTGADAAVRDVRVRRALNHAVDKRAIVRSLLKGRERPAAQPATHETFGFDPTLDPYPYDPARAKALLAQAGYGSGLAITMEAVPGTVAADSAVLQQVAAYLSKVGVKLTIRAVTFATYNQHYLSGGWAGQAFAVNYLSSPTLDALRPMSRHSCLWTAPWYCDTEVMPLIEAAQASVNLESRRDLTRQVMRRYHDQAAAIYLHEVSGYIAHSPRVVGLQPLYNTLHLEKVMLK